MSNCRLEVMTIRSDVYRPFDNQFSSSSLNLKPIWRELTYMNLAPVKSAIQPRIVISLPGADTA